MIRKKLHWAVCLRFYHEVADKISAGLQLSEGLTGTGTSDCKTANTHSEELVTSRRSPCFLHVDLSTGYLKYIPDMATGFPLNEQAKKETSRSFLT